LRRINVTEAGLEEVLERNSEPALYWVTSANGPGTVKTNQQYPEA
jgi:hypothetical protein